MIEPSDRDRRVLVLAPTGRDAPLTCSLLAQAGLESRMCATVEELCACASEGAAVVILAEETLGSATMRALDEVLERQEPWSDLPILLFTGQTFEPKNPPPSLISRLGNVTLLDRPVQPITMISATKAALRAREQQYRVREELSNRERALRDRDQFLAMLGHELRNPLNAILMAVELIEGREEVSNEQRIVRRQTRHLARLVDDLLDVARVTTGKIALRRSPVDVFELMQRCLASMEGSFRSQELAVRIDAAPGPWIVDGDLVRLEQILVNVLTNAVKYTPAGGRIDIAFQRDEQQLTISVQDTGVGISGEMLPRIFDLFAQVENTLDRAKGGMGIGLTLVRALVELHGGSVDAESDGLGSGTRMVIRLPSLAQVAITRLDGGPEFQPGKLHDILIVEDNQDSREMLQKLLEGHGHRVDAVGDGISAVERARKMKPQVMVIDIGLPGIDGYAVAKRVREAFAGSVYLIALSGYGQPEDRRRAASAGFDVHLTKPVELGAIEEILSRVDPRD